jgi:hypothetical protein
MTVPGIFLFKLFLALSNRSPVIQFEPTYQLALLAPIMAEPTLFKLPENQAEL